MDDGVVQEPAGFSRSLRSRDQIFDQVDRRAPAARLIRGVHTPRSMAGHLEMAVQWLLRATCR